MHLRGVHLYEKPKMLIHTNLKGLEFVTGEVECHLVTQQSLQSISNIAAHCVKIQTFLLGQLFGDTHLLLLVSKTVPDGHWHLDTQCVVQIGVGLAQVASHDDPHVV